MTVIQFYLRAIAGYCQL